MPLLNKFLNKTKFSRDLRKKVKTRQTMYVSYKRNSGARLCNHCCSGKAITITYAECVSVALGIQQCSCALLPSVSCPAVSHFPTYLINRTIFKNSC